MASPLLPFPTPSRPRPADCFYCRWFNECPVHAGEPLDLSGWTIASLDGKVQAAVGRVYPSTGTAR